jgi:hypothetical protein
MRINFTIAILAIALSGCAEYRARMQAQRDAQPAAQNVSDDRQCRDYGAQPGTQPYFDCRMSLNVMRTQTEAMREAQRQEGYRQMVVTGTQLMNGR